MQTILAEQPLVTAALLAVVAATGLYAWLQTGGRGPLAVGLVALLLIPVAWFVAAAWETDREKIRSAIETTARAVQANDVEAAIAVIDPARTDLINAARADLGRFRFTAAKVNRVREIRMVEGSFPPEAEVDIAVSVAVSDVRGEMGEFRVPRRVLLLFRKSADGRWLVHDYNHLPPIGSGDNFSPNPQFLPSAP